MRLLGNDFWDDIVDINERHKKKKDWSTPPKGQTPKPAEEIDKKNVSGVTIFYRVLGCTLLLATMIKTWFWSASIFDWALMVVALILIGVHRRLGAYYVIERVKPAFLDLHERLTEVEKKISTESAVESEDVVE
jgi:hypothetical protein